MVGEVLFKVAIDGNVCRVAPRLVGVAIADRLLCCWLVLHDDDGDVVVVFAVSLPCFLLLVDGAPNFDLVMTLDTFNWSDEPYGVIKKKKKQEIQ